jgi:L-aspartate oxidase
MNKEYDFLVIGSGLAGSSFTLRVADYGKVAILTKVDLAETNTSFAQGGIAAVTYKPDTYNKHIEDTIIAGNNLCNREVVEMVVREAPTQIQQLIDWGARFDRESDGKFDLAKEGGHSEHRILHHKDNTGYEIQRALSDRIKNHPNVDVFEYHFAIDLITQHHLGKLVKRIHRDTECYGVYAINLKTHKIYTFLSKVTLVATGGAGNLYTTTTNPLIATGDGIAMVYRAKGTVENMEFFQFHPTSLYNPGERPSFLITEALRGFGGVLKTIDGKEFMHKYDKRSSLAPRDIVARAIDNEMKIRGDDYVYLDCTNIDAGELKKNFPNIYEKCLTIGCDFTKDMIPVVPAAHYLCGGIKVDSDGKTWIKRLYAAGETASTGMHGANRLASNSLIEAVVYANRAAKDAIEQIKNVEIQKNIPDWYDKGTTHPEEMVLITQNYKEVQQIFSVYVGIVRSNLRLKRALDRLEIIYKETEQLYRKSKLSKQLCELRNLINVGYLIIKMAMRREESIGLHYNIDYPPADTTTN